MALHVRDQAKWKCGNKHDNHGNNNSNSSVPFSQKQCIKLEEFYRECAYGFALLTLLCAVHTRTHTLTQIALEKFTKGQTAKIPNHFGRVFSVFFPSGRFFSTSIQFMQTICNGVVNYHSIYFDD